MALGMKNPRCRNLLNIKSLELHTKKLPVLNAISAAIEMILSSVVIVNVICYFSIA